MVLVWVFMHVTAHLQEGKPPPKNMLKRSSGVMSASKPLWKSNPPLCEWLGLLGSSPPVRSYCLLLSGLLSTAYALPISEGRQYQRERERGIDLGIHVKSNKLNKLMNLTLHTVFIIVSHRHTSNKLQRKSILTFKSLCCSGRMIFVWMELKC